MSFNFNGSFYEGEFLSTMYKNAVFAYRIFVPVCPMEDYSYALSVNHDGLIEAEAYALQTLAGTGETPYTVCIGVSPASLPSPTEKGHSRYLRMNTYDVFSEKYPSFIVDELIPYLTEKYSLNLSASPDMHMVSGGSSGGVSAWNMAWHRNDYFRRVYMSSPSFLSMGRGDEHLNLMRKCETKPIRVFVDYSENEPDSYFGSSFCVAEESIRALRYAGYDMMCDYHPGEGHCSRLWQYESAIMRMSFLWKNWQSEPVTVKAHSERVARVVDTDSIWEMYSGDMPGTCYTGGYLYSANEIFYGGIPVLGGFESVSGVVLSCDKWRLYIGDSRRGVVYAATITDEGCLDGLYIHGALHHKTDFRMPGAFTMCNDSEDRLYVATETGIQCIRSFGLIDVILENPFGNIPDSLAIGEDSYLYAKCGDTIYRRPLRNKQPPLKDGITAPAQREYYDE